MNRKTVTAFVLALGISVGGFAAESAAAAKAGTQAETLDAKTLAFACGAKKLQFTKNGTLKIFSGDRGLGKVDLTIHTPNGWLSTSWSKPFSEKGAKFNGDQMQVTDIKAEGSKLTISGKVPWQKGDPIVIGNWKITAESCGKGKIKVEWSYEVPAANKYMGEAIFMTIQNCKMVNAGFAGKWDPATPADKNYLHAEKDTVITMEGAQANDTYRIQSSKWKVQTKNLRFLSDGKTPKVQAVFDLSEIPADAKK